MPGKQPYIGLWATLYMYMYIRLKTIISALGYRILIIKAI